MSEIKITRSHALGAEEAKKRIKPAIEETALSYGLRVTWHDGGCTFDGPAKGMVVVGDECVILDARLGFGANLFRSSIEAAIRSRIEKALG